MSNVCHIYDDRVWFWEHVASWRLRVQIPKQELNKIGFRTYVSTTPQKNATHIYHKHNIKKAMQWIKQTGGIYDVVDDHFDSECGGDYYREMCMLSPKITCSTEKMKTRIKDETGRDALIIKDPYDAIEYAYKKPQYKNTRSICWFGSETNLWVISDLKLSCKSDMITNCGIQGQCKPDLVNAIKNGWNYIPWVSGIMPAIFRRHDIAVLPYGDSVKQHAKSPNRIVDSLRNGMIVVTNDTPVVDSYGLREFCVVNNDISEAIESVWHNPEKAIEKVINGQDYIEKNLSPDVIAQRWAEIIKNVN